MPTICQNHKGLCYTFPMIFDVLGLPSNDLNSLLLGRLSSKFCKVNIYNDKTNAR